MPAELDQWNIIINDWIKSLFLSVQISESATVGTVVVQVSASDSDIGLNGKLTYKLVSGNEQGNMRANVMDLKTTCNDTTNHISRIPPCAKSVFKPFSLTTTTVFLS